MLTASSLYRKMFIARIGRIFSNMSITAAIVCVLSLLATIMFALFTAVAMMFAICVVILTLGIILAFYPNLFDSIRTMGERATVIINFLSNSVAPIASVITAAAGVLALIFLLLGEPKKDKGRIVFAAIVTVFGVIALIAILTTRAS